MWSDRLGGGLCTHEWAAHYSLTRGGGKMLHRQTRREQVEKIARSPCSQSAVQFHRPRSRHIARYGGTVNGGNVHTSRRTQRLASNWRTGMANAAPEATSAGPHALLHKQRVPSTLRCHKMCIAFVSNGTVDAQCEVGFVQTVV